MARIYSSASRDEHGRTVDQRTRVLMRKAKRLAQLLGHGYRVLGVNPGILLTSDEFARYPLDLPEDVADSLINALSLVPLKDRNTARSQHLLGVK